MQDFRQPVSPSPAPNMPKPPMPQQPQMQPHGEHRHTSLLWGILLVIIVVVAGLWLLGKSESNVSYDEEGNKIITARSGEFIDGFPMELILEEGVKPEVSYVIAYDGRGQRMPVARFTSKLPFDQVIGSYRLFLKEAGWTITKDANMNEGTVTNFTAMKDGAEANITIMFQPDASVVIEIAYLAPTTNPEQI